MPRSSVTAFLRRHAPFLLIVCAPTLLTALYFLLFAAPQYVSEAQFVVRGQSSQPANPLTHLMEGGGGGADENTYAVQDFLMSRDAAQELIASQNLKDAFDTPNADALARFPNFYSRSDFEHFWWYYQRHIIAELDTTTGLSTLTVRTFSPSDSQKIARALIASAEQLINRMNIRQRENTIHASQMEVQNAEGRLRDISKQIDEYRNQQALLDPNKQSLPMLQQITSLENALIATRLQVSQLHNSAPNSPLIPVYTHRANILEKQIAELRTRITGSDTSMVPKISDYDALDLQRKIIEKELATATAELDRSRAQANRQLLYLDEVTHPNLPDYPTYPKAMASIFVVFGTMFGLYAMGKLIINGAREHQLI